MRWTFALVLLLAAQAQPTFRSGVHLIVQPVSVKDKAGKPIQGLTAKDFVVTEDGRPQEIAFVEFQALETTAAGVMPPLAAVPPVTQEAISVPVPGDTRYRGRRLLILYFDFYGMTPSDQTRSLESAAKYVDTAMTPADLVAIVAFKGRGVRLLQDFTDDRAALRTVIQDLEDDAVVEHEPAVGDEDLTERERGREELLGEAVDPQQLDVQLPCRRVGAGHDDVGQPRRGHEDERAGDGHDRDRAGQHGPAEVVRRPVVAPIVAQAAVDRHERGRQAGGHEDVEGDLRDPERGVVGVELGAGAVGVGEHAVADDAHREVGQRQDGQDDRAAREDPLEQAPRRGRDGGQS